MIPIKLAHQDFCAVEALVQRNQLNFLLGLPVAKGCACSEKLHTAQCHAVVKTKRTQGYNIGPHTGRNAGV